MNEKVAKMLKRIGKSTKEGKRKWYSFNWIERSELIADYNERGDEARKNYTKMKKDKKHEQISV